MVLRRFQVLATILFVAAACAQTAPVPESILDTGPRVPSDEGVVTAVTFESITLEGVRTYKISKSVESFTTNEHTVTPLVHWLDRYVHVGVNKEKVALWVAGIGVVPKGGSDPRVVYAGVFSKLDAKGRAIFADGTVLKLGPGVPPPELGKQVLVYIDPAAKQIVELSARS